MKLTRRRGYLGAAAVLLLTSACSSNGSETGARTFEPEHIHGLALDDDTGRLLVATHDGLFEVSSDGKPSPVGDVTTDLMGFTGAPDGEFLASGHPGEGEGEGGPASLGLVTSSDGGASFEGVSLSGQADFHALDVTPTTVYGVDAGTRLLRSKDAGATWTEIPLPQPVADIAADPASDVLLATSQAGLLSSDNAGESFTQVPEAPILQLVDWADDGSLVGVDPAGQVYSADAPGSWTKAAQLAPAQAITTAPGGIVYVATASELLRSEDHGASFATVTRW